MRSPRGAFVSAARCAAASLGARPIPPSPLKCRFSVFQQTFQSLDDIEDKEAKKNVQRVEQLPDSVCFHTSRRPSPRIVPLCCTAAPTAVPTIADGMALAFPLAGPMGTRLHAAVTALIRHQQHPCNHLWDVVLKATSQRLAGSHGAQRGFFVVVVQDSPEVTLVIESVLRLLFEFQVMSGARVQCAEFSVHILRAVSC